MKFYSTKKQVDPVDLKTAVLNSLPADRGLYMPEQLNSLPQSFWDNIEALSFQELSFQIARCILNGTIEDEALKSIVYEAVNFESPLVPLKDDLFCLELFHGPSLAFKDFGARFMARLMSHLIGDSKSQLDILVATSGDTGGAVALGFYNTPNINVTILYPSGKVSDLQEKQLTTLGGNIKAIEVDGSFDDCQRMVKSAFLDKELNEKFNLSSANSINIARLIPQSFYYARAYQLVKDKSKPIAMCVPSGNFGNICAGLIAKKLGLPISQFIAANNKNNVFHKYVNTGEYNPQKTISTLSNAMDVGNPSNFERILDLYENDNKAIAKDVWTASYDDDQTRKAIVEMYRKYDYVACPHTGVAYLGAVEFQDNNPEYQVIFQATAHSSKFIDTVEAAIEGPVEIPEALKVLQDRKKEAVQMSTEFEEFKTYLLKR